MGKDKKEKKEKRPLTSDSDSDSGPEDKTPVKKVKSVKVIVCFRII